MLRPPKSSVRPPTLVDIAKAAGVAPMTASRAINSSGYVSEEVRERVLKAARKLNYRPNILARSLKRARSHVIGVMLPDIANPFSAELVNGLQPVLQAAGYSMFMATAGRSVAQEKVGLHAFVDHRVDGLLIATRGTQLGDEAIVAITQQGVPVVTVGRPVSGSDVDRVTADHWRGAYDVVTHLIALGHKRIGFIGVSPADGAHLRRYLGYVDSLRDHGIALREELVVGPAEGPGYATEEDGYEGMMRLANLAKRPTAVFARNDYAALGALRAAHDAGLAIPGDVAIAGFDNLPMSAYTTPPLTTVEQPITEQGRLAAEFLIDRIEKRVKDGRRDVTLDCCLIVRESTDARSGVKNYTVNRSRAAMARH